VAKAPHVLVLGGGFVAYRTVHRLRRAITRGEVKVTVVTRDNALAVHGLIGEMVTGRILPSTVLNPGRRVFAPASLHVAEIGSIDIEARKVVTSRHLDGSRFERVVAARSPATAPARSSRRTPALRSTRSG
jgi:NADH dehydrogenase FAD-containing subunit